jgi:predicted ArsR family transcriptional regulator
MVMADTPWPVVAALVDPVRRALYEHVRAQDHPVTREEAADAVAISRTLTAFHLDKLVDAGLLTARYESPPGQPRGRGRTPKVYEASATGLTLTVPPRRYELVGRILADAVAEAPTDARAAAERHAYRTGRDLGRSYARPGGGRSALYAALEDLGFGPREGAEVVLTNCPFHELAQRQTELVCGLNHAFVAGLLDGLGTHELAARLHPEPGRCCVRVAPA